MMLLVTGEQDQSGEPKKAVCPPPSVSGVFFIMCLAPIWSSVNILGFGYSAELPQKLFNRLK